jgi:hypothetical protein
VTYAGGGGGGINSGANTGNCVTNGSAGSGGSGVGGAGGTKDLPYGGSNGSANTGSGGGGGSNTISGATGGAGGSGIVVVKYFAITIPQISHKLKERGSFTMDTATVSSGTATYAYSGTSNCTGTTSGRTITVSFSTSGTCIITATASSTTASTTFQIVPNITQKLISRTGIQPNALSSFIPPPYLSTSETYTVTSCISIVGATGADPLSSTNLSFSLAFLLVAPGVITDTGDGKRYTITGTLAQVQAAFSIFKLNSSSGRIMAANSGSIYLRARTNLVVDSATDTGCQDFNDARITLYQYTSDQVRRKNVPQKSGSTP